MSDGDSALRGRRKSKEKEKKPKAEESLYSCEELDPQSEDEDYNEIELHSQEMKPEEDPKEKEANKNRKPWKRAPVPFTLKDFKKIDYNSTTFTKGEWLNIINQALIFIAHEDKRNNNTWCRTERVPYESQERFGYFFKGSFLPSKSLDGYIWKPSRTICNENGPAKRYFYFAEDDYKLQRHVVWLPSYPTIQWVEYNICPEVKTSKCLPPHSIHRFCTPPELQIEKLLEAMKNCKYDLRRATTALEKPVYIDPPPPPVVFESLRPGLRSRNPSKLNDENLVSNVPVEDESVSSNIKSGKSKKSTKNKGLIKPSKKPSDDQLLPKTITKLPTGVFRLVPSTFSEPKKEVDTSDPPTAFIPPSPKLSAGPSATAQATIKLMRSLEGVNTPETSPDYQGPARSTRQSTKSRTQLATDDSDSPVRNLNKRKSTEIESFELQNKKRKIVNPSDLYQIPVAHPFQRMVLGRSKEIPKSSVASWITLTDDHIGKLFVQVKKIDGIKTKYHIGQKFIKVERYWRTSANTFEHSSTLIEARGDIIKGTTKKIPYGISCKFVYDGIGRDNDPDYEERHSRSTEFESKEEEGEEEVEEEEEDNGDEIAKYIKYQKRNGVIRRTSTRIESLRKEKKKRSLRGNPDKKSSLRSNKQESDQPSPNKKPKAGTKRKDTSPTKERADQEREKRNSLQSVTEPKRDGEVHNSGIALSVMKICSIIDDQPSPSHWEINEYSPLKKQRTKHNSKAGTINALNAVRDIRSKQEFTEKSHQVQDGKLDLNTLPVLTPSSPFPVPPLPLPSINSFRLPPIHELERLPSPAHLFILSSPNHTLLNPFHQQ